MENSEIRFGVKTHETDYGKLERLFLECEKLGFDSVWISDHLHEDIIVPGTPQLELWTTLSSIAAKTSRVRLGTLVTNIPFRYPSVLAKMGATLDVISGGRLELGLGTGVHEKEFVEYGIPFLHPTERVSQLREGLQIIKQLWTEEKSSFEGKYYRIKDAECIPKPIQKPHPPIWVAAQGGRRLMNVVAELADGWNIFQRHANTPEAFQSKLSLLERICLEFKRDVNSINRSWQVDANVVEADSDLWKKTEELKLHSPLIADREMSVEEYIENSISGTPDECVEKIVRFVKAGLRYFICVFPDPEQIRSVQLFAEEVIPNVRKRCSSSKL